MHWLTRGALRCRWLTFLIAIVIIAASVAATFQLKTELLPDIELPYVAVFGTYEGHSPAEVMADISKPVEDEIQEVAGLKHIESTSAEGYAFVFATFEYGTNMRDTEDQIENRLAQHEELAAMLQSENLSVTRLTLEIIPLVWLTISSDNGLTRAELREVAQDLVDEVSSVEGILQEETPFMKPVEITGGNEDILVIPDADALGSYSGPSHDGIPMSWVISTLAAQSEYDSLQTIRDTPLLYAPTVTVDDVCDVVEPVPESSADGSPSVSIIWRKDPEANTVSTANSIMAKVEEFQNTNEDLALKCGVVVDQSEYIENSIHDLTRDIVIGVGLAAMVIVLFLWAFRAAFIIAISIPLSIFIAFLLMRDIGITVNLLTLSGLAIAVGRIVDDSIVCLENIYRHLQRGERFKIAAIDGVKEIAMPITAATIATVAIFIPLGFVGGIVGEMFRPLALTVTFAMLASLVIAFMIVPPLSSFMGTKKVCFERYDNWYTRVYTRVLRWALEHRGATVLIALALFIGSISLVPLLDTAFLPSNMESTITVEIEMPYADNADAAGKILEVEEKIEELKQEDGYIGAYYSYLGNPMGGFDGISTATIIVDVTQSSEVEQQAEVLREKCALIPETPYTTIKVTSGSMSADILANDKLEIRVIGEDNGSLDPVKAMTEDLTQKIQELEARGDIENLEAELVTELNGTSKEWDQTSLGIYAVGLGMNPTNETHMTQLITQLETEWALMRYGWPIAQLGQTGPTANMGGVDTGIAVLPVTASLSDIDAIGDLRIGTADPQKLSDLASLERSPAQLRRAEGGYAGTIVAKIVADDVGSINTEVQQMIDELQLQDGVAEIKMGGVAEQMLEGFSDMRIAILIAIGIAFAVLAIGFRSWYVPLLIMCSLPLASMGAVLALLVTGRPLGMSAMMGILMLVGIVLTNAIVLLTFVEDRRKEGHSTYKALMDAGRIRLRPILMTALTTMIALVPLSLALAEGGLIAAELGVVVIGGLFSSTLLTLIVIPVLYSLTERLCRRDRRFRTKASTDPWV